MHFDGLRDYTVGPASDCAARGGTNAGPSSMGGSFCYYVEWQSGSVLGGLHREHLRVPASA